MIEDFEPIGVYTDRFGRVLEVAKCEYCQITMPIKLGFNTLLRRMITKAVLFGGAIPVLWI